MFRQREVYREGHPHSFNHLYAFPSSLKRRRGKGSLTRTTKQHKVYPVAQRMSRAGHTLGRYWLGRSLEFNGPLHNGDCVTSTLQDNYVHDPTFLRNVFSTRAESPRLTQIEFWPRIAIGRQQVHANHKQTT
ncbi:hypothetical protein RRG08_057073 [Elysia crispata]|uniref:Uncharacterized protein n=1 Tax=Elysia crispata TaxID=231223 RepID=A0AAE1ANW5_9GAST|nr:hypothetical protein RRG08_057073 [Elysia crispata]